MRRFIAALGAAAAPAALVTATPVNAADTGHTRRVIVPGPTGFPPAAASPGAVGEPGYTPLIVSYRETNGFACNNPVRYVSTDSSDPDAARFEDVTYVPSLDAARFAGGDGTNSARASLAAFVNGQTGATDPNRQGLNSTLLEGLDPMSNLAWNPSQSRYSPLWDVFPAAWTDGFIVIRPIISQG